MLKATFCLELLLFGQLSFPVECGIHLLQLRMSKSWMSKLVIIRFLYFYFGYINTSWGQCIWHFLCICFWLPWNYLWIHLFFCIYYRKSLEWLTQIRYLSFRTPKSRKMNLAQTELAENALESCYRHVIIPLCMIPLVSAGSWTSFTGQWDHVFHLSAVRGNHRMSLAMYNSLRSAAEGPESLETAF